MTRPNSVRWRHRVAGALVCVVAGVASAGGSPRTLNENNEALFAALQEVHALSDAQIESVRVVFRRAGFMGQGNPAISVHPVGEDDCRARLVELEIDYDNAQFVEICGHRYMAPLYDPETQTPDQAPACIDQFEFPNIPCTYPVVWVRASEAARLCEIVGKRMCDAHEWEGACAGALLAPDYHFELAVDKPPDVAVAAMRRAHNRLHGGTKAWSYGAAYQKGICATSGKKSEACDGGGWNRCGSNTFPAGFFPECRSTLFVYDLHGNAAEHMNLPLAEDQMASRGSTKLGHTEMKGSWFVFDRVYAHEDWCRWRAPYWHGSRVRHPKSHHNYHLGFRCCDTRESAPR